MRIAVKLNLCAAKRPEAAATTHPVLAAELTRMLVERGAEVILGDSPGGPFAAPYIKVVYEVCGMRKAEAFGGISSETADKQITPPAGGVISYVLILLPFRPG